MAGSDKGLESGTPSVNADKAGRGSSNGAAGGREGALAGPKSVSAASSSSATDDKTANGSSGGGGGSGGDAGAAESDDSKKDDPSQVASVREVFSFAKTRRVRACIVLSFITAAISGCVMPGSV
jgi:hypothetical protein